MFPIIVNTFPLNGYEGVALTGTVMRIEFDQPIAFPKASDGETEDKSGIKFYNMNTGLEIPCNVNIANTDALGLLTIEPTTTLTGLTPHRLLVSSIQNLNFETMFGTFELKFTTEAENPQDYIQEPVISSYREVLMAYPKDGGIINTSVIKVKFSIPFEEPIETIVGLYENNEGMSADELLFVSESIITPDAVTIAGDLIEITAPTLEDGMKYTVVIEDYEEGLPPYSFSFYTPFSSYFTDVTEIRSMSGISAVLNSYSDYEIATWIRDNSELDLFIATGYEYQDLIDWTSPPIFVRKYVTYKTQYDILLGKIIEISSRATSKQLEDLTIEYDHSIADLLKLADKLKSDYLYWEMFLKGKRPEKASAGTFVRGENSDEIPEYKTRQLKDWDGTKSW